MVAFYRDVVGLEIQSHDGDGTTLGAGSETAAELRVDATASERGLADAGLLPRLRGYYIWPCLDVRNCTAPATRELLSVSQ